MKTQGGKRYNLTNTLKNQVPTVIPKKVMAVFVRMVFEGRAENGHDFENVIFRVPAIFKI